MNKDKLSTRVLRWVSPLGATLAAWSSLSGQAHAFGGLWSSQAEPAQQPAQQVLFVDPPGPTLTTIIRLQASGPAQELAWLVPVPGKPSVALSSNVVFDRLDAVTSPQHWVEIGINGRCKEPKPLVPYYGSDYEPGEIGGVSSENLALIDQGELGALEYVTLQVDAAAADPAQAALDWLTQNGYQARGMESSLLTPYLRQGYNLLAFKLRRGADRSALRPVALTYEGDKPVLPLRMASAPTQAEMGVLVWVVGPAQAVPTNVPSLVLNDALVDWSSGRKFVANTLPAGGSGPFGTPVEKARNYDALVAEAVEEAGGHGFVTELGQPASRFREFIWSPRDQDNLEQLSNEEYDDGLDLLLTANNHFGAMDGFTEAVAGSITLPQGVTLETFAADPEAQRGAVAVDSATFLRLLQEKVIEPVTQVAALMHQSPYLTRLFSVLRGAPELDPTFDYNPDLTQVHNVHVAQLVLQCGKDMPAQRDAAWTLDLPQGAQLRGRGGAAWPLDIGTMPANLKVVMLSTRGAGEVVSDNSSAIRDALKAEGHGSAYRALQTPQHGQSIGGDQSILPKEPRPAIVDDEQEDDESEPDEPSRAKRDDGCSVRPGVAGGMAPAWLFVGLLAAAARRRRRGRGEP